MFFKIASDTNIGEATGETNPPMTDDSDHGKVDFTILNSHRMSYYTTMFIGSNKQEIKVAFDTMTPMSLLNSANCQGC